MDKSPRPPPPMFGDCDTEYKIICSAWWFGHEEEMKFAQGGRGSHGTTTGGYFVCEEWSSREDTLSGENQPQAEEPIQKANRQRSTTHKQSVFARVHGCYDCKEVEGDVEPEPETIGVLTHNAEYTREVSKKHCNRTHEHPHHPVNKDDHNSVFEQDEGGVYQRDDHGHGSNVAVQYSGTFVGGTKYHPH